ncbi:hypothetical protein CK220_25245 [Mesorhizobium sp. WSM3860]|nr:hypothetical protein CK220_25245 [Mesorhizobium sp. WSM3860]
MAPAESAQQQQGLGQGVIETDGAGWPLHCSSRLNAREDKAKSPSTARQVAPASPGMASVGR